MTPIKTKKEMFGMKYFVRICCLVMVSFLIGSSGCSSGCGANATKTPETAKPASFVAKESPVHKVLAVQEIMQEKDNWCWAASMQMCLRYLHKNVSQCEQANRAFNSTDCCNNPFSPSCDKGNRPDPKTWGFNVNVSAGALSWEDTKFEISHDRPFIFTWIALDNRGGHALVATGYAVNDKGRRFVQYINPARQNFGKSYILYDYLVKSRNYRADNTFYNMTKMDHDEIK